MFKLNKRNSQHEKDIPLTRHLFCEKRMPLAATKSKYSKKKPSPTF